MNDFDSIFPAYTDFDPSVPVWCVTPNTPGCFHRFFDTSPISPSGRYLAVTSLMTESRLPAPDDTADIVLIDLRTGETRTVATSGCFDTQLGSQAQWGRTDDELYFNDIHWEEGAPAPVAIRLNPETGQRTVLGGPVYMVSPDGRYLASPCLLRTALTQPGYGAVALPRHVAYNHGAPYDDGIFRTNTDTGRTDLFISIGEIVDAIRSELEASFAALGANLDAYDVYGFHVKWTPKGDRLLFVIRARTGNPADRLINAVVTIDTATKQVYLSMPPSIWSRGGHHPQWHPDGEHIIMNLKYPDTRLRFVKYRFDGTGLEVIADPAHGGGHPSIPPGDTHILTDEYEHGDLAYPDGTTPIRFVELKTGHVDEIIRIRTRPDYHARGRELRVDPHPAWDPTYRYVVFNACPTGKRQVFLADLGSLR